MNTSDLTILKSSEWSQCLEAHILEDPAKIALSVSHPTIPTTLLATQVKYLQKAAKKLPSFYHKRCILTPRAFEQSSSEITAQMKPFSGNNCLDLTGGLGVDSVHFSNHFSSVTTIEADPILVEISKINLCKLEATNVEFHLSDAQTFLNNSRLPFYDLIYLDPDRRTSLGQRVIRLEDCQPPVLELIDLIFRHTNTCVIKVSPLFDIDEAFRKFNHVAKLHVLSVHSECKELLIEVSSSPVLETEILINTYRNGQVSSFSFLNSHSVSTPYAQKIPENVSYIYEPDVAFYKARCTQELFAQYFPQLKGTMNHSDGYFFAQGKLREKFPGRVFAIRERMSYQPRKLKKRIKSDIPQRIHLTQRYFPLSIKQIQQQLPVIPGGDEYLIFTMDELSHKHVFRVERIDRN